VNFFTAKAEVVAFFDVYDLAKKLFGLKDVFSSSSPHLMGGLNATNEPKYIRLFVPPIPKAAAVASDQRTQVECT